ncbi:MAG: hypothetical protein ABS76_15915 [Pelagibacterium sp. SCN 64-44]|nr:MAG: hypothetical protein ABS76_15915 [Pelagibacterium sp. SCN 64-44]
MGQISISNASKSYGAVNIIKDLDLEINDGEFVVLVGPSGCGKSTLLRMIAGLEDITSGTIAIDGQVVNDFPPQRRDVAMVFQNYALYPHYDVYQNMAFGLKIRRLGKDEIDKRVREAAHILGLTDLLKRRPKQLSGGQRQRVAMGRAIVRDPRLYLFDEPLSNLDAKLRISMRSEIKTLHQRLRRTTVYVTHDQVEAMTMADRIVIMRAGIVEQVGTPWDLYTTPANQFVAGFIGAPTMNFVSAKASDTRGETRVLDLLDGSKITVPRQVSAGRDVVVGIRPEHVELGGADALFTGTVTLVEPTGPSDFLLVQTSSGTLTIVVPSRSAAVGDAVSLSASSANIHLFDAETGARID